MDAVQNKVVNLTIRQILTLLLQFGAPGLFLLAIADDSFLFVPIGSDLLLVLLVVRNEQFLICVLAAAAASVIGVFLLDLVARKSGEEGLKRLIQPKRRQCCRLWRRAYPAL